MSFDSIPTSVKLPVQPYTVNIPDSALTELKSLLQSARLAPKTFESTHGNEGRRFGLTREWMVQAKERWTTYDW